MKLHRLSWAAATLLVSLHLGAAADTGPGLSFRGFGTLGPVRTNSDEGQCQREMQPQGALRELIGASAEAVAQGAQHVNAAGTGIEEIVGRVSHLASIVDEITAAAQAQSTGIADVSQAVDRLDDMTQRNAALVEQGSAAATHLREQALQLSDSVHAFRTPQLALAA